MDGAPEPPRQARQRPAAARTARKPPDPLAADIRTLSVARTLAGPVPPHNSLARIIGSQAPPESPAPPGIAQAITETRLRRFRVWAIRELRALGVIARGMEDRR